MVSSLNCCGRRGDNHVDFESNELGSKVGKAVKLAIRISGLDNNILSLDVTEIAQTLPESLFVARIARGGE